MFRAVKKNNKVCWKNLLIRRINETKQKGIRSHPKKRRFDE
jgi:hypothetical protein